MNKCSKNIGQEEERCRQTSRHNVNVRGTHEIIEGAQNLLTFSIYMFTELLTLLIRANRIQNQKERKIIIRKLLNSEYSKWQNCPQKI